MKKRISSLFAALLFLLPLLASTPIHGADATSFDPTRVEVKAKGSGGVPVGTINVTDKAYRRQFTQSCLRLWAARCRICADFF